MRQLIINKNPDKKGLVLLDGKDFRYLRQVLRVKAGDMVNLRLPDGILQNSTVCKIDDNAKRITLQVCGALREPQGPHAAIQGPHVANQGPHDSGVPEPVEGPQIEFSLFQFIPKPQKLELIVRQATECGVKNIIPVISEYAQKGSVESIKGGRIERLERIIREARQQSGSPVDTKIFEPVDVEGAIEIWNKIKEHSGGEKTSAGFVLSERAVAPDPVSVVPEPASVVPEPVSVVPEALEGPSKGSASTSSVPLRVVSVFCGNEGGISPDELELLIKKALLQPVHFSVNILRCETAALYGIAAIQTSLYGF